MANVDFSNIYWLVHGCPRGHQTLNTKDDPLEFVRYTDFHGGSGKYIDFPSSPGEKMIKEHLPNGFTAYTAVRTGTDSGYVGYWQTKPASGNGYMGEALSALEQELFNFGFNKILIEIDDGNIRSENVAKRNGYEFLARRPMASWAESVGKCDELV